MTYVQNGLRIKNISDLVRKEIHGPLETKNPTKEQIRKYKRAEKEINKKSKYNSKFKYVRSDLISKIIKNYRGVKKCNDRINRKRKKKF